MEVWLLAVEGFEVWEESGGFAPVVAFWEEFAGIGQLFLIIELPVSVKDFDLSDC